MVHISTPLVYRMPCFSESGSYIVNETGDMRHVVDQYFHIAWNASDSFGGGMINSPGQLFVSYEVELYGQRPEPAPAVGRTVTATPISAINVHKEGVNTVMKRITYTYPDSG